jgi:glutaminyl-tRNA synthetase
MEAEVRLYHHLFTTPAPDEAEDITTVLNPDSLERLTSCQAEPSLANAAPGNRYQFERHGYFCVDTEDTKPQALVFNRTVSLRDTWAKMQQAQQQAS